MGTLKLRPKDVEIETFRARIYPQSTAHRLKTERQIDDLVKAKFIERSTSPISSACFLVAKANSVGKFRLVLDLRNVNKILEQDCYELPTIPENMNKIGCSNERFCLLSIWQAPTTRSCSIWSLVSTQRSILPEVSGTGFGRPLD